MQKNKKKNNDAENLKAALTQINMKNEREQISLLKSELSQLKNKENTNTQQLIENPLLKFLFFYLKYIIK